MTYKYALIAAVMALVALAATAVQYSFVKTFPDFATLGNILGGISIGTFFVAFLYACKLVAKVQDDAVQAKARR